MTFFQLVLLSLAFWTTEFTFIKCWYKTWYKRGFKILIANFISFFFKTENFLFGILVKKMRRSFSGSITWQSLDWSSVNCRIEIEFKNCTISFLDRWFVQRTSYSYTINFWFIYFYLIHSFGLYIQNFQSIL